MSGTSETNQTYTKCIKCDNYIQYSGVFGPVILRYKYPGGPKGEMYRPDYMVSICPWCGVSLGFMNTPFNLTGMMSCLVFEFPKFDIHFARKYEMYFPIERMKVSEYLQFLETHPSYSYNDSIRESFVKWLGQPEIREYYLKMGEVT